MSSYTPVQPGSPIPAYQPPPTNGLGVAGFVVSLSGLVVCAGLPCPLGLVMSAIALRKEPRGFAIAGVITGLIGTLLAVTILLMASGVVGTGWPMLNMFGPQQTTSSTMWTASNDIDAYFTNHNDTLPDEATGTALIAHYTDAYGNTMKYRPTQGSTDWYELVSAGEDGVFGNGDDYIEPMQAYNWNASTGFDAAEEHQEGPDEAQISYSFDQAATTLGQAFSPTEGGDLPTEDQAKAALANTTDAWGRAFRYAPTNPPYYQLQSAGADGVWHNEDDHIKSYYFEPTGG